MLKYINIHIFLLFSGDIFYQCITHESTLNKYSPINGKACYALDMWEKALSAQAELLVPLTLTDKCNMQYIYESKGYLNFYLNVL